MTHLFRPIPIVLIVVAGLVSLASPCHAESRFVPPEAGEHPRLFFRKADLPAIRERAKTPEGRAIVERLRYLLNGGSGDTLPPKVNPERRDMESSGPFHAETVAGEAFTLWHAAGYGMLYQLTGDKRYADLGRKSVQMMLDGVRDRDRRYSFRNPHGALRAGPSLAAMAMAYDLNYDGWDRDFRSKVALEIQGYQEGANESLPELANGSRHHPGSNHWGPQIGGAGIALLAIRNDPGVDAKLVEGLITRNLDKIRKQLTRGMGPRGYFAEHVGPGQIASDTAFVPALQAYRVAAGKDLVAESETAQWLTLRWIMWLAQRRDAKGLPIGPYYPNPVRVSGYGGEYFTRRGLSRGGQFAQGFGAIPAQYKPALLWTYQNVLLPTEATEYGAFAGLEPGQPSYDTVSPYPHRAVLALVNWPIGVEPRNPGEVMPRAVLDTEHDYLFVRDRWKDHDDVVLGLLRGAGNVAGSMAPGGTVKLRFWGGGERFFGTVLGRKVDDIRKLPPAKRREARRDDYVIDARDVVLAYNNRAAVIVDRTGASGADVLVVVYGASGGYEYQGPPLAPVVEPGKLDLTGDWGGLTITQDGSKVIGKAKGSGAWTGFEATLEGYVLNGAFQMGKEGRPDVDLSGTVDSHGNTIRWQNGTTWNRKGFKPPPVPPLDYEPGDIAKVLPVPRKRGFGRPRVVSFAYDGEHPPDPVRLEDGTLKIGGQTVGFKDGTPVLGVGLPKQ